MLPVDKMKRGSTALDHKGEADHLLVIGLDQDKDQGVMVVGAKLLVMIIKLNSLHK